MWSELYKYFLVFFSSMFKFFMGPVLGKGFQLPELVTVTLTIMGMMASVILFTSFLGKGFHQWILNRFYKNKKLFTKGNRRKVYIWKRYGLVGVAFLTPILFTPIGGAMIANGFGESKERIFLFMLISATGWAFVATYLVSYLGNYLPGGH